MPSPIEQLKGRTEVYYQTENGLLLCGDAIELIKLIPKESIDLIVTDPPYGISRKGKKINVKEREDITLDFGEWDHFDDGDFLAFTQQWFSECVRVLKDGAWFYSFFSKKKIGILEILSQKYGIKVRDVLVWCKTNPVPSFRKRNWLSATEFIFVASKGDSKIKNFLSYKEMFNYFLYPNKTAYGKTKHPTEKPEFIIEKLIKTSSNEGEVVLDLFAGSGTTLVVAEKMRRKWIGIELNPEYCEMAKQRLQHVQFSLNL